VDVDIADRIATVTFSRPPVNAVDSVSAEEIANVFVALGDRKDVSAVIFTASGDRAFMAGVDLNERLRGVERENINDILDYGRPARRSFWSVRDCPLPVVCAVNGPAIGMGIAYVSVCDVIVAAENARFGTTEVKVGVLGAFSHLQRMVGPYKARKHFFSGELISAEEMYRLGAVDSVVPRESLLDRAREVASLFTARSPIALRLAKESVNRVEALPLKEAYRLEQDYTRRLGMFDDSEEAMRAYLEKRDPRWEWS